MFKNKLLKWLLGMAFLNLGIVEEGGGGGDFDVAGAVDTIGGDLFGTETEEENAEPQNPTADVVDPAPADKPAGEAPTNPAPGPATDDKQHTEPAAPQSAPRTWRPEAAAAWAQLPPTVQAEVLKREEDMFKGLEGYKANAQVGQTFQQVMEPYKQFFQHTNTDPVQLTNRLYEAHAFLSLGTPEQKLAKINEIASAYGVQIQPSDPDAAPYIDPTVKALQDELATVKSQLSGQTQWQQQEQQRQATELRTKIASEVDTFAADPANAYFAEVSDDIAALLKSGLAKDLKDAYQQAIYRNPATRQKEVERQARETAEAQRKIAQEAADKAKKSMGANVRTTAKQASGTATLGSMDDTLSATLANIKSRDK